MFQLVIQHRLYSRRVFFIRERLFFKSLTDVDSVIPPKSSRTKRNWDRKNLHTRYQPKPTRVNTNRSAEIIEIIANNNSIADAQPQIKYIRTKRKALRTHWLKLKATVAL